MLKHSSSCKAPQRSNFHSGDLMSLQTIQHTEFPQKNKLFFKPEDRSLRTKDIEGARPRMPGYGYVNKPEYTFTTHDIAKSFPRELHPSKETPNFSLKTDDIEKAQPCMDRFKSTRHYNNPLNPVYQLPSFQIRPVTPPKFVRDQIAIQDIEGSQPDPYFKWKQRDIMNVNDIEGARPKPETKYSKPNLMDPQDINKEHMKKYSRQCNPLMPVYVVRNENNQSVQIGKVEGSIPKVLITNKIPHDRHLTTKDIAGGQTNTRGIGPVGKWERNYQKPLVNSSDIEGAQAGSKRKGIITQRVTHPLNPVYSWFTQETKEQKPKVEAPVVQVSDPVFISDTQKFWGVKQEEPASNRPKTVEKNEFTRNSAKFFLPSGALTPNEAFEANVKEFFNNPQGKNVQSFYHVQNPYSIHKPKPNIAIVDQGSANFQRDTYQFFNEFPSRPSSVYQENGESKRPVPGKLIEEAQEKMKEGQNYQFKLARNQIGTPSRPNSEQSERKLLSRPASGRSSRLVASGNHISNKY